MGLFKKRGAAKEPVAFTFSDGPVGLSFVRHTLRTKQVAAVLNVVAGSQAQTQGVEPGMFLVEVGGHSVQGVDYNGCMAILEREVKNRPLVLTFGADLVGAVELAESDAAEEAAQRLKLERRLETLSGAHKAALDALREELSTPSTPQVQGAALDVVEQDAEIKTLRDAYNVSQARLAEADAEMKARASEGGASTEAMAERHAEALQGMRDQVDAANAEGDLLRAEIAEAKLALQERVQASAEAEAKAAKEQAESQRKLGELGAQAKNLAQDLQVKEAELAAALGSGVEKYTATQAHQAALASARAEMEQQRVELAALKESSAKHTAAETVAHERTLKEVQEAHAAALIETAEAADAQLKAVADEKAAAAKLSHATLTASRSEIQELKESGTTERIALVEQHAVALKDAQEELAAAMKAAQEAANTEAAAAAAELRDTKVAYGAATAAAAEENAQVAETLRQELREMSEESSSALVTAAAQHEELLAAAAAENIDKENAIRELKRLLAEVETKSNALSMDLHAQQQKVETLTEDLKVKEAELHAAKGTDAEKDAVLVAKDEALASARVEAEQLRAEFGTLTETTAAAATELKQRHAEALKAAQAERMVALADAAQAAQGERDAQLQQLQELQEKHRAAVEKNATLAEMHANTESLLAEAETNTAELLQQLQEHTDPSQPAVQQAVVEAEAVAPSSGVDVVALMNQVTAAANTNLEEVKASHEAAAAEAVATMEQHVARAAEQEATLATMAEARAADLETTRAELAALKETHAAELEVSNLAVGDIAKVVLDHETSLATAAAKQQEQLATMATQTEEHEAALQNLRQEADAAKAAHAAELEAQKAASAAAATKAEEQHVAHAQQLLLQEQAHAAAAAEAEAIAEQLRQHLNEANNKHTHSERVLAESEERVKTLTEDLKVKEAELHAATRTDAEKDAVLVAKDEALASARVEAEQLRTDIADLKESTAHEIVMLKQQHAASIKAAQEALADAERLASTQATAAGAELTAAKDDAMQTRQLLAEAEAKAKSLAQDLQARVLELQTAETDLAAAVGSDADRGAAIKAKDQALADARAEVERLQSEATELRARATTAETVLTEQHTKEMKATQDDHATTKRLLSEAEAKCQKMAKDLQGNEAKLAAAAGSDAEKVAANTTREQALTSATAEVEKLRGSLAEARDQYALLERNLVEADGQAQTLGQELQARVVELMGKETELKEAMGALAEQDAARAAREEILTRSRVEVEHLRSSLANAKRLALAQAQSTSTELSTAKEEIEMLKLRLKVLEETGKEASKSLKKALEAKEATLETARRTQQAAAEAAAKQQTMEINEAVEHDMSLPSRGRKFSPRLDPIATVQRLGGASRAQTSGATERPSSPQFSSNASSRRRMARKRQHQQHQQQKEMQEAWASNGPAQISLSRGSRVSSHSPGRLAPAVSGKRVMALNHQTKPILARAGLLRVSRMLVPSPERPAQPPRRRSAKKHYYDAHSAPDLHLTISLDDQKAASAIGDLTTVRMI
eukprot:COSAG05_NODE_575_length_8585_cov_4.618666_4_plen_1519_part_00